MKRNSSTLFETSFCGLTKKRSRKEQVAREDIINKLDVGTHVGDNEVIHTSRGYQI